MRGRSVAWVPPLLLLVAIAVADYHTIGAFRMISWIVLVPGIAAALCGVWGTTLFAVVSLVTYVVADSAWPHEYRAGRGDFVLVALGGILAVLACAIRVRDERRALHMGDVTDTIRRTVLRPLPPGWGGLDHAGVYLTADAHARVGGDFYDIQPGPHGTRVLVGDVQGKGLGAVEAAAALLGTFREAAYHEADLATVAEWLETRMIRHRGHTVALGRSDGDLPQVLDFARTGGPPPPRPSCSPSPTTSRRRSTSCCSGTNRRSPSGPTGCARWWPGRGCRSASANSNPGPRKRGGGGSPTTRHCCW